MDQPLTFPPPLPSKGPGRPVCRRCGSLLDQLDEPRCSDCGTPFDPGNPNSYARKLVNPRWAMWVPGVLTAFGIGMGLFVLAHGWLSFGYGLVIGTPVAVGFALGYLVEQRTVVKIGLTIIVLAALLIAAVSMNLGGIFCGAILGAVIFVPLILSAIVGSLLRRRLDSAAGRRRRYAPVVAIVLSPLSLMLVEARFPVLHEPEVVETSRIVHKSALQAWNDLVFFEEIEQEPPLLTRIGLPRPLRTDGEIRGVGDRKVCVYDKGWLTKRITEYRPGELLAFDVTEQRGIEDRSVELLSGSFHFEELGSGGTRITLTTVYRPLLAARALWRPFEHSVTRTLHEHVLDGIERAGP